MAYSVQDIRIVIPVKVDQSTLSDGAVVFRWKPANKMELIGVGFVVSETFGSTGAVMSLEVEDVEKAVLNIPGGTSVGTEVYVDINPDIDIINKEKIELVAKDVANEAGEGYFVLYYRQIC